VKGSRAARPARRHGAIVTAVLAVICACLIPWTATTVPAGAADARDFDPGYIISDRVFYDSSAMSESQVQQFLNAQGAQCAGGAMPCLKNYSMTTTAKPAENLLCNGYSGGTVESAARIIVSVGQSCGINPQVLIVLLQKEQSLITATAPTTTMYRSATGYGCPDTAPCDAQYYGFFNQVYQAARQFKLYARSPTSYGHIAGRTNNILFNPNAACGAAPVFIVNQATAGLYNYTPYQPNAAALNNLYGTGDGCSTYGNRNFWRMFTDWFGAATNRAPIGTVDSFVTSVGSITVSGWALDPDTANPIAVHIYTDSTIVAAIPAAQPRPDVDAAYRNGPNHGFAAALAVPPGPHTICAYAIDSNGNGPNPSIGCTTITVPTA